MKMVIKKKVKSVYRVPISKTGGPMKSKKGKGSYNRKKEKFGWEKSHPFFVTI